MVDDWQAYDILAESYDAPRVGPTDPNIAPPAMPDWVPPGYQNPGLDQFEYKSPWDVSQYKTKQDVVRKQDQINYYQAVADERRVQLEEMLKGGGYVLKDGRWGKYEGGGGSGDIVQILDPDTGLPTGQYSTGASSKFVPLDSPAADEWTKIKYLSTRLDTDTANWSEADDEMIYRLLGVDGSSSSGGGGGGSSSSGPRPKTFLELEQDKADEVSRQRAEGEKYTDQYYDTVKNFNDIQLQEASRAKASNAMWSDAFDKATEADVLRNAGKLQWNQGAVAPTWADPLHYIDMEKADRAPIDMWHDAIPEYILPTYYLNAATGLPGGEGFNDEDFPQLTRFGNGTPIWDQIRNGTMKVNPDGSISSNQGAETAPKVTYPPQAAPYADYNPSTEYGPGRVPLNSVLPTEERIADQGTWVNNVVDGMIGNILSGKGGYPPGYDGPLWNDYTDDKGRSVVDPNFKAGLTAWVAQNTNNPGLTQIWGAAPTTKAVYIDDPSKPPASQTTIKATATPTYGGGAGGGQNIYTGVYGGQGSAAANDRSDPDLDKKLGWEREKFNWQKELDIVERDLAMKGDLRADEVLALQKRQQEARERIDNADLILREIASELEKNKFEYTKEQNEKLLEFDKEKWEYQKGKDESETQMRRAEITANMLSKPNDPFAAQFFYRGMASPEGEAFDVFTGESRGRKTRDQAYDEDSELFRKAQAAPKFADGGFTKEVLSILGDSPDSNRATGNEEMVWNPTGAPLAFINNKDSKRSGLVPPEGKQFGKHVKAG